VLLIGARVQGGWKARRGNGSCACLSPDLLWLPLDITQDLSFLSLCTRLLPSVYCSTQWLVSSFKSITSLRFVLCLFSSAGGEESLTYPDCYITTFFFYCHFTRLIQITTYNISLIVYSSEIHLLHIPTNLSTKFSPKSSSE
jgi:hypothetical protein